MGSFYQNLIFRGVYYCISGIYVGNSPLIFHKPSLLMRVIPPLFRISFGENPAFHPHDIWVLVLVVIFQPQWKWCSGRVWLEPHLPLERALLCFVSIYSSGRISIRKVPLYNPQLLFGVLGSLFSLVVMVIKFLFLTGEAFYACGRGFPPLLPCFTGGNVLV